MSSPILSMIPWHLNVNDAHCHPTDTMAMVPSISTMQLSQMIIMATSSRDQDFVADVARRFPDKVTPSFGFHPWYSHLISNDMDENLQPVEGRTVPKAEHYKSVLTPEPTDEIISNLPEPLPLSTALEGIRVHLRELPTALVGEIGMDRGFRIPEPSQNTADPAGQGKRTLTRYKVKMDHQKVVFRAQLGLAGELCRPVSVHAVACHGAVFDTFRDLWRGYEIPVEKNHDLRRRRRKVGPGEYEYLPDVMDSDSDSNSDLPSLNKPPQRTKSPSHGAFPPRVCLHSFSGARELLQQYLKPSTPGVRYPSEIFFSYSTVINTNPSRGHLNKISSTLDSVPDDRVLIESDLHTAGEEQDSALAGAVSLIAEAKGWSLEDTVTRLNKNWQHFVHGARK